MSNIDSPAVARRRVRLAVRSARQARKLTQTQIAQAMEWSLSKVIRIEKGDVNVSPNDLRVLLDFLEITDPEQVHELLEDARRSRQERWIVDPADREHLTPAMIELLQFEHEATTIRYYHNQVIPGIMQTREYAQALFEGLDVPLDSAVVAARIATRGRRLEQVLLRRQPPAYLAVLDESVLKRPIGGNQRMIDQLEHLIRIMQEPTVLVRILPLEIRPKSLFLASSFALFDLDDSGSALLYRESGMTDEAVHSPEDIDLHRSIFEKMWSLALNDTASAERIAETITELRSDDR